MKASDLDIGQKEQEGVFKFDPKYHASRGDAINHNLSEQHRWADSRKEEYRKRRYGEHGEKDTTLYVVPNGEIEGIFADSSIPSRDISFLLAHDIEQKIQASKEAQGPSDPEGRF